MKTWGTVERQKQKWLQIEDILGQGNVKIRLSFRMNQDRRQASFKNITSLFLVTLSILNIVSVVKLLRDETDHQKLSS